MFPCVYVAFTSVFIGTSSFSPILDDYIRQKEAFEKLLLNWIIS